MICANTVSFNVLVVKALEASTCPALSKVKKAELLKMAKEQSKDYFIFR